MPERSPKARLPRRPGPRRLALLLAAVIAGGMLAAPAPAQTPGGQGAGAPARAGYIEVAREEVPVVLTLTGRAAAYHSTQLRPRVSGMVTEIPYRPGTLVEAGTPLFVIDPLTYELALASAEAAKARAEAERDAARLAFDRTGRLQGSGTSSEATLQTAEATLRKAEASLREAEAGLVLARAQLDWTTLRAPIRGIVGMAQISVGDLVTQNQTTALAEIVQTDPINIDLSEPWSARLRAEARAATGEISLLPEPELTILTETGHRIAGAARMITANSSVSTTTGTRTLRFEFENPSGLVAPGAFIHAEMILGTQEAILAPQRATSRERDGSLSAWVVVEGKAQKRRLTETGTHENAWIVTAGLEPGDRLLIDGTNNLREGQEVAAVAAMIDPDGVVRDRPEAEPEAAPAEVPTDRASVNRTGIGN